MTQENTNARVRCCVPFCKRTGAGIDHDGGRVDEVICGPHWRAADADLRRRYNAERRRLAPLLERDPETLTPETRADVIRDWRWLSVQWSEIKRQAIDAAVGI